MSTLSFVFLPRNFSEALSIELKESHDEMIVPAYDDDMWNLVPLSPRKIVFGG